MNSDSKFFLGVIAVVVLLVGGLIIYSAKGKSSDSTTIDTSTGYHEGSDSAKVKIVEFADFECPYCAQSAPILQQVVSKNPDDVELIYRYFPLITIHQNAQQSAQAAEAAGIQGKFWQMNEVLFSKQSEWENLGDPTATFLSYAQSIGLDTNKFQADYKSDATVKRIKDDLTYAENLGLNETPTFFVNGEKMVGVKTADEWQTIIDSKKSQ